MNVETERNSRLLTGAGPDGRPPRALKTGPVPPFPVRAAQRVAMKAGLVTYERHVLRPLVEARRRALGQAAAGPPRFLVRVDEFPHYRAGDEPKDYGVESSRAFHAPLAAAGVQYLMAIVPRVTTRPLDPEASGDRALNDSELEFLAQLGRERVTFGLHGYNHRTRYRHPRRHSELCGLTNPELEALLDRALAELAPAGVRPRVFVPPYNRFDASQYEVLAERFDVVCGGPESVPLMGFHSGPQWRGDAVYLPCYAPLYGTAEQCLPVIADLVSRQVGTWVPIVLHPGWEMADPSGLERFAREIAPYAASWDEFLEAVDASRA
jgi:Uncharacterized protein conserved in bacteria (DUF2334)